MKRSIILVMVLLLISCYGYAGYIEDGTYEDVLPCEEYIGGDGVGNSIPSVLGTIYVGNTAYLDILSNGEGIMSGSGSLFSPETVVASLTEIGLNNYITSLDVTGTIRMRGGSTSYPSWFSSMGNKLEYIHIGENIIYVDMMSRLFKGLTSVKGIVIDAISITSIRTESFSGCINLENVSITNWTNTMSIENGAFYGCAQMKEAITAGQYFANSYAFSGIESVTLPSGCILTNDSFADCTHLASITCETDINFSYSSQTAAFPRTSLSTITVNSGGLVVWTVDSNKVITADDASRAAYPNLCLALTSSGYTFYDPVSRNLKYELASDGSGYYVSGLGSHTADLVINVPAEHNSLPVLGIKDNSIPTFGNSTVFKEFNFLGNITTLGSYAFQGSANLERITGLDSVTYIGAYCFNNCPNLEELTLPTSTPLTIGAYAFNMLPSKITSFTIPENVVSLGEKAVNASNYLTELNLLCPPTAIAKTVVSGCPNVVVKLNAKYFLDWIYASNGYDSKDLSTEFAKDYAGIQLTNFSSGFLLDSDNKIKSIQNLTSDEIYVPAVINGRTVTGIKNGALRKNGVTKILIDNSNALDIEDYAVGNTSLSEIIFTGNIPPTVASHSFVAMATATTFFPYYNDYKDTNKADIQVNTAWVNLYKDSLVTPAGGYRKMLGYGGYKGFSTHTDFEDGYSFAGGVTSQRREFYWISPSFNRKPVRRIGNGTTSGQINGWFNITYKIQRVHFPEGLHILSGPLFANAVNLTSPIELPDSLVSFIGANQFDRTHIPSIVLAKNVHAIPVNFCSSCASLTAVVIPAHITNLGAQSFGRLNTTAQWPASGIKEITFEGIPPLTIANDAFYSVTDATIYYPSEYSEEWGTYTANTSFKGATNVTWVAQ